MKLPQNSDHTEATDPKLSAKKPYEKPAFRFEQVFETRAELRQNGDPGAVLYQPPEFLRAQK